VTEVEFLNRFQRQPNGVWAGIKPIKIDGPNGPIIIGQGASLEPGASFMGLDLAKELDRMATKHPSSPSLLRVRQDSEGRGLPLDLVSTIYRGWGHVREHGSI
jgi:hypothetical protein